MSNAIICEWCRTPMTRINGVRGEDEERLISFGWCSKCNCRTWSKPYSSKESLNKWPPTFQEVMEYRKIKAEGWELLTSQILEALHMSQKDKKESHIV